LKILERVKGIEPSYSAWKAEWLEFPWISQRPFSLLSAKNIVDSQLLLNYFGVLEISPSGGRRGDTVATLLDAVREQ
jgi:hypothetical protein